MTEAGNNYSEKKTQLHISVRNLVEFIFREGDIDNRSSRAMSADAMMEGTRIHRKIQGSMGKEYQAEVPLSLVVEGDLYELTVEGRQMASLRRMESVLSMRLRECTEGLSCLKSRFLFTVRRLCAMHIFLLCKIIWKR